MQKNLKQKISDLGNEIIQNLLEEIVISKGSNVSIRGNFTDEIRVDNFVTNKIFFNEEICENKFDIILSFFELTYIFDIEQYFKTMLAKLAKDGIFIGCFLGENSFYNLRTKLWSLEESVSAKIYSRILPMMRLSDLNSILYNFGLKNIISFKDSITTEHNTLIGSLCGLKSLRPKLIPSNYEIFPKKVISAVKKSDISFDDNVDVLAFVASRSSKMFATKMNM